MAYNITKPNIFFDGDVREINDEVKEGEDVSVFNIKITHAKNNLYKKIVSSQKDIIEIKITPFNIDTNSIIANYIILDSDFSSKTLYFTAGNSLIAYALDYDKVKYTKNTIIAIYQINPNKIVIATSYPLDKKTYEYGVLLTIKTEENNTIVTYNDREDIDTNETLIYWDYEPTEDLLGLPGKNTHLYEDKGTHYVVIFSNSNLKFPLRTRTS